MPPSPPRPHRTARPGSRPDRSGPPHSPLIRDLLASGGQAFSFEFMPPKTEAEEHQLWRAIRQLEPLRPDLRLGDLRGRRVDQGPDRPGDRPDRRGDHADPGRPFHRGEPLGGRAQAGDRGLRGGRGAQRARAARRPARRPERQLGPAPRRAELRGGTGPHDQVGRRLLRRGGRVPGEAPALARSGHGRALLRGQVPGRGGLRHHQHVLLPRGLPAAAGSGRGARAATCRSSRASCR